MTAEANEGFERYEEALKHVRTIGERKEQVKIKFILKFFFFTEKVLKAIFYILFINIL